MLIPAGCVVYKGSTITRNAREGDPAVKVVRKGVSRLEPELNRTQNDVVKLAHKLNEVKSGELRR
jgi:hypothetical protein